MKPNISEKEIKKEIGKKRTLDEVMTVKLRYSEFREFLKFIMVCFMDKGFVLSSDVKDRFRIDIEYSLKKLKKLVTDGLIYKKNINGSSYVQFIPVLDEKGEPIIYRYYEMIKKYD
jgi:hypothetical protein